MTKLLAPYTTTVREMLMRYNVDLAKIFNDSNIEEIWVGHDNWSGGIDFYEIVLSIPVNLYMDLQTKKVFEETEKAILNFYIDAMRGDGDSVQIRNFILKPTADEISIYGTDIDDSMWKNGFFRLFISHLSEDKNSAQNLKLCLRPYGIDCFVAHEDISPSKEWEIEIEKALFTMDALCAIVVPEFKNSKWCDQEVGIALGQKKVVIPINKGSVPHGFFGKYQALNSKNMKANDVAKNIWKILSTNDNTQRIYLGKFVSLILNATNENDALQYIEILMKCDQISRHYVENLYKNITSNDTLNKSKVLNVINPFFERFGLDILQPTTFNISQSRNNADLPF